MRRVVDDRGDLVSPGADLGETRADLVLVTPPFVLRGEFLVAA
ncbi:hypothetical protein [Frankia sp. AgKG'84/4]|nr:hypothetical protein [Frankia sp. AgKG'84/4]